MVGIGIDLKTAYGWRRAETMPHPTRAGEVPDDLVRPHCGGSADNGGRGRDTRRRPVAARVTYQDQADDLLRRIDAYIKRLDDDTPQGHEETQWRRLLAEMHRDVEWWMQIGTPADEDP